MNDDDLYERKGMAYNIYAKARCMSFDWTLAQMGKWLKLNLFHRRRNLYTKYIVIDNDLSKKKTIKILMWLNQPFDFSSIHSDVHTSLWISLFWNGVLPKINHWKFNDYRVIEQSDGNYQQQDSNFNTHRRFPNGWIHCCCSLNWCSNYPRVSRYHKWQPKNKR